MYKIGDKIVYPLHGAGEITGLVERHVLGVTKNYYKLKMTVGEMEVMIPVSAVDSVGVRDVITEQEANDLIEEFRKMECDDVVNWNKRYRENMQKLKSGSILKVANVVKGLMIRDKHKGLSTGERKMLTSAKQILLSEIVIAKKINTDQAEKILANIIVDH
ncbi:MAG: CarD family transcriptional regulator [Clostridia bacterium]